MRIFRLSAGRKRGLNALNISKFNQELLELANLTLREKNHIVQIDVRNYRLGKSCPTS